MRKNLLILGGTTEASALAESVAARGITATLSYAGRVAAPRAQPVATRSGGFGGAAGLAQWLADHAVTHLIDATHPFAAAISANAVAAAGLANIPLLAMERRAWEPGPSDRWQRVPDIADAADALAGPPRRVFLALGRLHLAAFARAPQHDYLLRLIDPPDGPLPLPRARVIIARGPFDVAGDTALMRDHGTEVVVAKNAGGTGAVAKLTAARTLGLPVILIERPAIPPRDVAHSVAEVIAWLGHSAPRGV